MNGDESAFPDGTQYSGLTKRELFAAMAMKEFSRNATWDDIKDGADELAECAILCADALIAALSKEPKP